MHLKPKIFEKNYFFFQKWLPLLLRALWTSIKLPKELFFLIWGAPFYFYINFPLYILCREDDSTWSQRNVASLWFYVKFSMRKNIFTSPLKISSYIYKHTTLCKDKRIFLLHLECLYTTGACCFSFKLSIGWLRFSVT